MGQIESFLLVGGHVALDFANTLGGADGDNDEWLHSDEDVARWADQVGIDDTKPVSLEQARALRAVIYAVFAPIAAAEAPPQHALDALADAEREALAHATLTATDWEWHDPSPLWPVTQAAIDLLRSELLDRLKQCEGCRWLYLDASRNRSRRWCSMEDCGTAAKMRRRREKATP